MGYLRITICALLLAAAGACGRNGSAEAETDAEAAQEESAPQNLLYGIDAEEYRTETGEVGSGETLGKILGSYGVPARTIDLLDRKSKDVFPLRSIRAGQKYTTFIHEDSLYAPHLDYLAYEISTTEYVVFGFHDNDSVSVRKDSKPYTLRRTKKSAVINSSLWGAIMEHDLPYALAAEMEDIYQWTVDFFGIQKGDSFTVIYDERFIDDTVSAGIGRVWGAKFTQSGKEYYAIPFRQGGKIQYWEADGGSLRKQLLKAPLKYTRISSRFTYARKQRGGLLAKGRMLGVQFEALLAPGVYERIGAHENALADRLRQGIAAAGYGFVCQTRTNQLFPVFPDALVERLEADFGFHRWGAAGEGRTAVRLVTSWSTQAADVEAFLQALA